MVLPSMRIWSISTEVNPSTAVVVDPTVSVEVPNVIFLVDTAPLTTVKLAVLKLATPRLLVEANSASITIDPDESSL